MLTGEHPLTSTTLDMILNTLYPTTSSLRPHRTILTLDHGEKVYINDVTPLSAYQAMLDANPGTISDIWANYSPCPYCARKLLDYYEDGDNKPTIHIARIYTESDDLSHVLESLKFLVKLKNKGFKIVAWNFNEFKASGGFTNVCTSAITTAYANANFTSELQELGRRVTFIQALGDSKHADS